MTTSKPMFSLMEVVTDRAAMPMAATIPSSSNTSATLIVAVMRALNVEMPFRCFIVQK